MKKRYLISYSDIRYGTLEFGFISRRSIDNVDGFIEDAAYARYVKSTAFAGSKTRVSAYDGVLMVDDT